MSNVMTEVLVDVARAAEAAGHGQKAEIYAEACARLNISLPTLHRKLHKVVLRATRKRRADAGVTALKIEEAKLISAVMLESIRKNGKQMSSHRTAVGRLRSSGLIMAASVDLETGEMVPLSESAIRRALYQYRLHPSQLLQPAPAVELASNHPNHVWQIDASLSTQFYLADKLESMPRAEFYKNKPENFKRIERLRLWRYVITDHTSGSLYVEYVLGAESSANICNVLINAMQKRGETDPFCGVPFIIMTDPGAAMTSSMFRNLCRSLSIKLIINKVGNARAKGQVEQAHNIVENEFESGLTLQERSSNLDQINDWAWQWMRFYNAIRPHSRTGHPRYSVWQRIKPEQLRIAPSVAECQQLAITAPQECLVNAKLRVNFRGNQFDVSSVPGVIVGEKLRVTSAPLLGADAAHVVVVGDAGIEHYHAVPKLVKSEWGFVDAQEIGGGFASHADTPAQTSRKELERLAMGAETDTDAAAARKGKAVPFGGAVKPYKPVTDTTLPSYMPKRGVELDIPRPSFETPALNLIQVAKRCKPELGDLWNQESYAWVQRTYPDGVREDQIDQIISAIREQRTPAKQGLRVVGGA